MPYLVCVGGRGGGEGANSTYIVKYLFNIQYSSFKNMQIS